MDDFAKELYQRMLIECPELAEEFKRLWESQSAVY